MPIKMYIYLFVEQLIYVFICDNNSYFPYFLFCCKTANMINNLFHYLYINLYMFVLLMNIEIIPVAVTSL